jgi:AAA15 family ATPase/GTPase
VASTEKNLLKNCVKKGKFSILNGAAIYGPNASGKSNLIKAIHTIQSMVFESAKAEKDSELPVTPFLFDEDTRKSPSSFEITFLVNDVRYQYGFKATKNKILEEWLYSYPVEHARLLFNRKYDEIKQKTDIKFGPSFRGEKESIKEKTQNNMLVLSIAGYWNNELLSPIYDWLAFNLRTITTGIIIKQVTARMIYEENPSDKSNKYLYSSILSMLRQADFAVDSIEVKKAELDSSNLAKFIKEDQIEKFLNIIENEPPLRISLTHKNPITGELYTLDEKDESEGTKRFFELIGPWLDILSGGYTVFVDEIDKSLHPLLVRELIKVIQNSNINTNGAQLIFATHNTAFIDSDLFRRDQIWFTDRDKSGATNLYSLWDYKKHKARIGESLQNGYLSGRYGALPIIQEFEMNEPKETVE